MATIFLRGSHSRCFFWYVTSKNNLSFSKQFAYSPYYFILLFTFWWVLKKKARQRDIWRTLQNIFKIFHRNTSFQWCKPCLATYFIKPCLAILETFFWLYYWLVLGSKLDCYKQRFHLMQLARNYGEPHIYLHQVFQRFWLGKIYLQICLQRVIFLTV